MEQHRPYPSIVNLSKYRVKMTGADLSELNLKLVYLAFAKLMDADMSNVNLTGADLRYANFFATNLAGADLRNAVFLPGKGRLGPPDSRRILNRGAKLQEVDLRQSDLSGASLVGADLTRADLSGANLSNSVMSLHCLLRGQFNQDTILPDGNKWSPDINMHQFAVEKYSYYDTTRYEMLCSYFKVSSTLTEGEACTPKTDVHFREKRWDGVNWSGKDLAKSDLHCAKLKRADLSFADLSSANLLDAMLTYTNLTYANLSGAILAYSSLKSADLTGANLSAANLFGMRVSRYTTLPDGRKWTPDTDMRKFTNP